MARGLFSHPKLKDEVLLYQFTNTHWMIIDLAAPIEAAVATPGTDYKCNAYVCRGYQYEDNVERLQTYKAGDVVPFHINLVAGHRPGWAVRS